MLTNLIHLNRFQFYSYGQFSADPATWFVFLIFITGVAGCGFGSLSLIMFQRHIKQKHRNIIAQFDLDAFLLCILFVIMSAGTYLLFRVFLNEELMR